MPGSAHAPTACPHCTQPHRVSSLDPPSHFVSCVSSSVFLCAHLISWWPHAPTCQTLGLGKLGPFFPAAFGSALSTLLTKGARSRLEIWGFTYYCISSSSVSSITLLMLIEEDEKAASMETARPILYNAWISSCSHRVRIALNLKDVDYEYKSVNPRTDPDFEKINPIKYIPALVDGDIVVSDSLAISLYLEDKYPAHPLLPKDPKRKALNLQIASIVCSSIQPLQGYAVIGLHEGSMSPDESLQIVQRYTDKGFRAIEKLLDGCESKYATGDDVQLGDVFLEPQIHAGINRFQIDMSKYPILARLHDAYMEIPAFQAALPKNQPDAPSS